MEQLRIGHNNFIEDLKSSHSEELQTTTKSLEKKIASLNLDLKATKDDLTKSKTSLSTALGEVEALSSESQRLKAELESAQSAVSADASQSKEIESLKNKLAAVNDELSATAGAFQAQKETLTELMASHQRELEGNAQSHVEQVQKLKNELEEEKKIFAETKSKLESQLEDERIEKERARAEALAAQTALHTPPMSPKANGNPPTPMIAREDLQRVHEANSAKISELEAEHGKELGILKDEIEALKLESSELKAQLSSRNLELHFLEEEKASLEEDIERYVKAIPWTSFAYISMQIKA